MKEKFDQVRPRGAETEITFGWKRGQVILDIDQNADGPQFVISESGQIRTALTYEQFSPSPKLAEYGRTGLIVLPSGLSPQSSSPGELASGINGFIDAAYDCDEDFRKILTCWIPMTYLSEQCQAVPYLRSVSPPASGKSRLAKTLAAISYRSIHIAGSASLASIYRLLEISSGTLILDEADFERNGIGNDFSKVLNQGYEQGCPVIRNVTGPDGDWVPKAYDVFGPKFICGRRLFADDATETRTLLHRSKPTRRNDIPKALPPSFYEKADILRNQLMRFRLENLNRFTPVDEHIEGLDNRTNQIILPLLTVARKIDEELGSQCFERSLLRVAHSQDRSRREQRFDSVPGRLVDAYVHWTAKIAPIVSELRSRVLRGYPEDTRIERTLTAQKTGDILRELGFETRHTKRGSEVSIDHDVLNQLKLLYGVEGRDNVE